MVCFYIRRFESMVRNQRILIAGASTFRHMNSNHIVTTVCIYYYMYTIVPSNHIHTQLEMGRCVVLSCIVFMFILSSFWRKGRSLTFGECFHRDTCHLQSWASQPHRLKLDELRTFPAMLQWWTPPVSRNWSLGSFIFFSLIVKSLNCSCVIAIFFSKGKLGNINGSWYGDFQLSRRNLLKDMAQRSPKKLTLNKWRKGCQRHPRSTSLTFAVNDRSSGSPWFCCCWSWKLGRIGRKTHRTAPF